jgi:type IV pilus assembly protein PilC
MPTYQFEAMDSTGQEIKDVIEAQSEEEAQATIRQMGYFVTKIAVKKQKKAAAEKAKGGRKRSFALGGVNGKVLTTFTRQLSILQDAGLPILRSLRILEAQCKGGRLKNSLMDVCDEIEGGSTLSEGMAKAPKAFNRLYVNMIKAGEAGGALEIILQRLAEFQERAQSLRRKIKGAMIYPIVVVSVAVGILTFIMIKIVPSFQKIFDDFDTELPPMTVVLITISNLAVNYWFLIPGIPISLWLFIKLLRKFKVGRDGWDMFTLKMPIFGPLVEKNILARTTRTLGTLVSSGVPILEALHITKETSGNAVFEELYGKVYDAIREGESIATPLKENSKPGFHPVALFFWFMFIAGPIGALFYMTKMNQTIMSSMVVNMVDVGEESGELDTMLYKVADTFDEEVSVLTESLVSLMEPLLIIVLGGAVGFIVIALFMPLVKLITDLSK